MAVPHAPVGMAQRPRRVPDDTGAPTPTAHAQACAQTLCRAHHQATLRRLCAQHRLSPTAPRMPAPVHRAYAGRRRQVDTSTHFCPNPDCASRGWVGWGNLRANGHPNGGPWRQFHCTACEGSFLETHGTLLHGKRVPGDLIVHVLVCLAEGLGIRATARVFEVAPNPVLHWLIEAAEQLRAFSAYVLCDLHLEQLQLDELYAVLRDCKAGAISDDEAIKRLERSPFWVWTAMDPKSKLLLVVDVGGRTLAMAQRVVHQVTQVLAPDCIPLCLTDGLKHYTTALLTHFGYWMQAERRQDKGPIPKPRWMPLPKLLYAHGVKSYRRRHLVGGTHHVVFGTQLAMEQGLAACGWGRSRRPLWSASTSISVSGWRRSGAGSTRSARAKRACEIS